MQDGVIINVDSRKRDSGDNNSFTINLNLTNQQIEHYDSIVLLKALIPKSYYLIDEPYNKFTIEEEGVEREVSLPIGSYNRMNYQSNLQNQLNTGATTGISYSVNYSSSTSSDTGKFLFVVTNTISDTQPIISIPSTGNMGETMGFDRGSINPFVNNVLLSTNILKLIKEDALIIRCDGCYNEGDFKENVDILDVIYNSNPNFSNIEYFNFTPQWNYKKYTHKSTLTFQITNEDKELINFNGINILLMICIFKKKDKIKDDTRREDNKKSEEAKTELLKKIKQLEENLNTLAKEAINSLED